MTIERVIDPPVDTAVRSDEQGASSPRNIQTLSRAAEPILVVGAMLLVWQALSWWQMIPTTTLPAPSTVARELAVDVRSAEFWESLSASLRAWVVGLLIIVGLAVPIGTLVGVVPALHRATQPTFEFFRTIPSVAALPVLMFMYGAGYQMTVTLVVLSGAWPLLIHTTRGLSDVDPVLKETARVFNVSTTRRMLFVLIPAASPYILTGLRISATIGLLMAVGASLIVGGEGLGELIFAAQRSGDVDLVYARVAAASLVAVTITFLMLIGERRVLRWHVSQRGSEVL